jgi:hypothetical protein
MSRFVMTVLAFTALSSVVGCASSNRQSAVPHSFNPPGTRFADDAPTDQDLQFVDNRAERHAADDAPLTGSLRPQLSTHSTQQTHE